MSTWTPAEIIVSRSPYWGLATIRIYYVITTLVSSSPSQYPPCWPPSPASNAICTVPSVSAVDVNDRALDKKPDKCDGVVFGFHSHVQLEEIETLRGGFPISRGMCILGRVGKLCTCRPRSVACDNRKQSFLTRTQVLLILEC